MFGADKLIGKLQDAVQGFELPKLGSEVAIPVYVIHNSSAAEDYFFIFDFEQFVQASRKGLFVRPKLQVWSGRDDFGRRAFAQQFRTSFGHEFDAARAQLDAKGDEKQGWFGYLRNTFGELRGASFSAFLANLVLLVAMSSGKAVLAQILPNTWFGGGSDTEKLEAAIENTQAKVDTALRDLDITLHPELMDHAFRDGGAGPRSKLDRDAWPLPAYVRKHLQDGTSGSWW